VKGKARCAICYSPRATGAGAYCLRCKLVVGRIREVWQGRFPSCLAGEEREDREQRILAHQERVQVELQRQREGRERDEPERINRG